MNSENSANPIASNKNNKKNESESNKPVNQTNGTENNRPSYLSAPLHLLPPNTQISHSPRTAALFQLNNNNNDNQMNSKEGNANNRQQMTTNWINYLSQQPGSNGKTTTAENGEQTMIQQQQQQLQQQQQQLHIQKQQQQQQQQQNAQGRNTIISTELLSNPEDDHKWTIQWLNEEMKTRWDIKPPKFKNCKRRVEEFSSKFTDTWYKAPYKYHVLLEVMGMKGEDQINAVLGLTYENGRGVQLNSNKEAVANNHNIFSQSTIPTEPSNDKTDKPRRFQSTIGPFQFNVCSYKQDGRKFRIGVYLYRNTAQSNDLCAVLMSDAFTIRAKKTSKKKKRKREQDGATPGATQKTKLNNGAAHVQDMKIPGRFTNDLLDVTKLEQQFKHKFLEGDQFIPTTMNALKQQSADQRIKFIQAVMENVTAAERELMFRQYFSSHSEFKNRHSTLTSSTSSSNSTTTSTQPSPNPLGHQMFKSMLSGSDPSPQPNMQSPNNLMLNQTTSVNDQAFQFLKTLAWGNYLTQLQNAARPFGMPLPDQLNMPLPQQPMQQPPQIKQEGLDMYDEEESDDDELSNMFHDLV